jgi:hypothetical protein
MKQSDTRQIALVYSAKSVNIVAGGKAEASFQKMEKYLKANSMERTCQKMARLHARQL